MMEIPILSDVAKINKWNDICLSQNWSAPEELERWLYVHGILFTSAGSCLGTSLATIKIITAEDAELMAKKGTGEEMATRVLEALSGAILFSSTDLESIFWKNAIDRLNMEADLFMPPEIVPKIIREILKYPGDENQGSV